jgi:hypothetical protein
MEFRILTYANVTVAEVVAAKLGAINVDNALDLFMNCVYQGAERIIVYEQSLDPEFFDLKTGVAGEILQKVSNYRLALCIVGDFSKFNSRSLQAFIAESNKSTRVRFVSTLEEAVT